ncbi:hypothetical protein, partial [Mesorhizobium sp. M1E.F.Ca.ET.063.01.1.1]|uniref:hypothetical protein n=1 Tax=Mesorhizobium sp. M1E.F.Ca.ET.063.01.1.1 TaxID=2496750 RepID=UPI001AED022F
EVDIGKQRARPFVQSAHSPSPNRSGSSESRSKQPRQYFFNSLLEQFQEKCATVGLGDFAVTFRSELRKNKQLERFSDSTKR